MKTTDQSISFIVTVVPDRSLPGVLAIVLVSVYSVAQGATVLRDFVYPSAGGPVAASLSGTGNPITIKSINLFGSLVGNFFAGAPTFVLLAILFAGIAVYRGRTLVEGTLLTVTLTVGVFIGVLSIYELVTSSKLPFLVTSAFLLGGLFGGSGALVGAGVRYVTK